MLKELFPWEYAEDVFSLDYRKVYKKGFRAVIFDIDNTLVPCGGDPTPETEALFREIRAAGLKVLLLSGRSKGQMERFNKNLQVPFIHDAEKPSPVPFIKAVMMLGLRLDQVLCIGDQMFTDVRGANRACLPNVLVRFIRKKDERRIGIRRYLEFLLLALWRRSRKYRHRIGNIYKDRKSAEFWKKDIRFRDISPLTSEICEKTKILKRNRR